MLMKINYNKDVYFIIDQVLQTIPQIRPGKGDTGVLVAFYQDYEMFLRFRKVYLSALSNETRKALIQSWNEFIFKRDDEGYIPHFQSRNIKLYQSLFNYLDYDQ